MNSASPEAAREQFSAFIRIVRLLPQKERTALYRWYVLCEDESTICMDVDINPTEFQQLRQELRASWRRILASVEI
jgi:phytoene/squalene synthetase